MGAKKFSPIPTHQPETGVYEMNANLSGSMWSVAPVLATMSIVFYLCGSKFGYAVCWGVAKEGQDFLGKLDCVDPLRVA
jgi:hypothetical protein